MREASKGHVDEVQYLVDNGARVDIQNINVLLLLFIVLFLKDVIDECYFLMLVLGWRYRANEGSSQRSYACGSVFGRKRKSRFKS